MLEVQLVDRPGEDPIFVSLDRVHPCHKELPDTTWTGRRGAKRQHQKTTVDQTVEDTAAGYEYTGPLTRSRAKLTSNNN